MEIIYLVTGNPHKVVIAQHALSRHNIKVEQVDIDTPEIQSDSVEEVVKYSVKYAAEHTQKAVIKNDFGLHIDALNGFPGPFIKYINKWISPERLQTLMQNESNRQAHFIDALGYCEPGKEPVCFTTITNGIIINTPRKVNGNMADSLFIPDGHQKTISELNLDETLALWTNDRYDKLVAHIRNPKIS